MDIMKTIETAMLNDDGTVKGFDFLVFDPVGSAKSGKAEYFKPRSSEIIKTSDEIKELKEKLKNKGDNEQITVNGETIPDNRGKQFFYKDTLGEWVKTDIIVVVNVTRDSVIPDRYRALAIEKKDLSAEQAEEIRIQLLTDEEKEKEVAFVKNSAMNQAINKRSGLEILGDTEALEKSQIFYQKVLTEIDEKYSIKG